MITRAPLYTDLDLRFLPNALTGDCALVVDEAAVRRAVFRVVKTRRFDVPYEPDKSSWIDEFLFEPASPATEAAIRERLKYALTKMEPRASYVVEVESGISPNGYSGYTLTITYTIKSIAVTASITEFLERIR